MPLNVKTRNVSLTPENEAFITERVASGRFSSASEVVRAALRLLADEERRRTASDRAEEPARRNGDASNPAQG
jgi:antitoxin ParD1/3/4